MGKIEPVDPKYIRLKVDLKNKEEENEKVKKVAHEVIDEIYTDYRLAVDREINEVDELFLRELAKQSKEANEIELTNLLYEKDKAEENALKRREVKQFLEQTRIDVYNALSQNEREKNAKAKRGI